MQIIQICNVITQTRIDNIWRKKLSEKIPTVEFCAMVCFFLVWNRVSYRCSFPLPEFTFLCYQKILEIFKNFKKILKGSIRWLGSSSKFLVNPRASIGFAIAKESFHSIKRFLRTFKNPKILQIHFFYAILGNPLIF